MCGQGRPNGMDIDTRRSVDEETVFRHLLRVLAQDGSHPRGLQEVLETALRATGAQSGVLMVSTHQFVAGARNTWANSPDVLQEMFANLESSIQVNPPQIQQLLSDG